MSATNYSESRFDRQEELVPRERLIDLQATVIGVGAIGRQVALQLASLGANDIQLIDFDAVESSNITTQGYASEDAELRLTKVEATRRAILRVDPQIRVTIVNDRYRPTQSIGQAVFCCVDTISARAAIWRTALGRFRFWVDARMLGEVIRVLTATDQVPDSHYAMTLFAQSDAQVGRCTARGTIYTANIAAGLMIHQFVRWLRGQVCDRDASFDLLASDYVVA